MPDQIPAVGMERKLAAIFSTDVAGYSRLMGDDEEATIRTLTAYREVISSLIQRHRGRVVDSPGDNLLAEFASVVDAVRCALEIQHALKEKNAELPDHRQMQFRIGINLGDVIVEGERLYGDGVNIAARLESLAEPGGVCISGTVYDQVETKLALTYEDLGEQAVKNIAKPVRVFRVVMDATAAAFAEQLVLRHAQPERTPPPVTLSLSKGAQPKRKGSLVLAGLFLIAATFGVVWYFSRPPLSTQDSALRTDAAPLALPLPDKPSLMVMPFVNMSKDPDQEYFSDGLTETLTGDLSKISGLFVISRNSAFTYKGKAVKVQDVGHEMGVRYVLEGSVQKADNQVRINAQLIEAATGYHLWSEHYDRPLQNILILQDEIVQQLVTTLRVEVHEAEQQRVRRIPTTNLSAYDALLRAAEYFHRVTPEGVAQARPLYEQAVALDPQYGEAYAWLGWTYWEESHWNPDPQKLEQAMALAQQAIALDDSLAVAHSLVSLISARRQQSEPAIAEGERAVVLDPNSATSAAWLGEVLTFEGRPAEAIGWLEKAMRLDPHYPYWFATNLGGAYIFTGRYAEAIATSKQGLLRSPHGFLYTNLAAAYLQQWGEQLSQDPQTVEQALVAAQRAVALMDSFWGGHRILDYVYLSQKQYEQAVAEMERAVALYPNGAESYASLAEVLSLVGRVDEALRVAEQARGRKSWIADSHLGSTGVAYAGAGRFEEAQESLQQFRMRYPEFLGPHLALAALYSRLDKEAEAQAEAAEVLRLNPNFSLEIHKQRVPIKDPAVLERHITALRKAGLQ